MPQYGYSWTFPIAIYQVCQLLFLQLFHLIECFNRTDKWKSESPLAHHQVTPPEVITDTRPNRNVLSLHAGDMFNCLSCARWLLWNSDCTQSRRNPIISLLYYTCESRTSVQMLLRKPVDANVLPQKSRFYFTDKHEGVCLRLSSPEPPCRC